MLAQRRNELSLIRKRMEVVFLLFLIGVVALVVRLCYLQWLQGPGFYRLAVRMQSREYEVGADRGRIKDRNRTEMAQDVLTKAIAMNPQVVTDKAAVASRLASLLGLEDSERQAIRERLLRADGRGSYYSQLRRGVERRLAEKILTLSKKDPTLKGLWLEDWPTRVNPCGRDGLQLIGHVGMDGGAEGIELKFDEVLRGKPGRRRLRVGATGVPIPDSEHFEQHPEDGKDIVLTIDRDVQHFVEAELDKVAAVQKPDAATAVVLEVETGDVLAMANWPNIDPSGKSLDPQQRRNRAVTDLFEPGSIFKVFTGAAALETGINTNAHCGGSLAIGNRSIRCAHGARHGAVGLRRMIEQSCNIAAGTYAQRVGPEKMYEILDAFGLQEKSGIEFPGEEYGRMLKPEKWRAMRTANIGFGQGIVVTPLQLIAGYAAIANDGVYNAPRLVLDAGGAKLPERKTRRVMTAENARTLREHMEAVVTSGTGKAAKIAGYSVGGKTGTAQIAKNGRYGHGYVASFAGFVPVRKPRLAILVSVWHPRRDQYGGVVSAPVFREIARQSVAYLKIPPDAPSDLRDGANPGTFTRHARASSANSD